VGCQKYQENAHVQGGTKMSQFVFVRTASNLHQIWQFLAHRWPRR